MRHLILILIGSLGLLTACSESETPGSAQDSSTGLNLNVSVIPAEYSAFEQHFSKYINVFGVPIFATSTTPDAKVEHTAHVLAQYLDNNADGSVDDAAVVESMVQSQAFMLMTRDEDELENLDPESILEAGYGSGQAVYGTETNPSGGFDASLEEVLHLITDYGYALAHASHFDVSPGSVMTNSMDTARGGQFIESSEDDCDGGQTCALPAGGYPEGAWYTYTDDTCSYNCMATEYFYWALSSLLGAQAQRCDEIDHEWLPCTPEKVQAMDQAAYDLFTTTDESYVMPTLLPDGNYQGPSQ